MTLSNRCASPLGQRRSHAGVGGSSRIARMLPTRQTIPSGVSRDRSTCAQGGAQGSSVQASPSSQAFGVPAGHDGGGVFVVGGGVFVVGASSTVSLNTVPRLFAPPSRVVP